MLTFTKKDLQFYKNKSRKEIVEVDNIKKIFVY